MPSKHPDATFRFAAERLYVKQVGLRIKPLEVAIESWGAIERPHSGGAWVGALLFVPEAEADREQRLQNDRRKAERRKAERARVVLAAKLLKKRKRRTDAGKRKAVRVRR